MVRCAYEVTCSVVCSHAVSSVLSYSVPLRPVFTGCVREAFPCVTMVWVAMTQAVMRTSEALFSLG